MTGKIPAVLYGPGGESLALTVDPVALTKALQGPYRRNQLLEIDIAGTKELALIRDLDIHPVTRAVRHADFYRASLERPVVGEVPLRTKGRAKGVTKGGELQVHFRTVLVKAVPNKLPAEIMLSVDNLDTFESIRVKDVQLEAGVEIELAAERVLVFCTGETKKIVEEEAVAAAPAGKKK
jgi:large subunit ribosomal protein L25